MEMNQVKLMLHLTTGAGDMMMIINLFKHAESDTVYTLPYVYIFIARAFAILKKILL